MINYNHTYGINPYGSHRRMNSRSGSLVVYDQGIENKLSSTPAYFSLASVRPDTEYSANLCDGMPGGSS